MTKNRIALITDPGHPGLRPDDLCLVGVFGEVGLEAVPVAWGSALPREEFTAAVIRTPWDYFERAGEFMSWVDAAAVPLINSPAVLRWNHHKGYLVELQDSGIARLPKTALVGVHERPAGGAELLERVGSDRAVLKPAVSGGAFQTIVVTPETRIPWGPDTNGDFLIQAFVDGIQGDGADRGEWSLVYFGGIFSHALRKVAQAGDFRVQEEHGGRVLFEAPSDDLVAAAGRVLDGTVQHLGLDEPLPYARVDMVVAREGEPLLMELELIEPELFFRVDPASPGRFARAIASSMG